MQCSCRTASNPVILRRGFAFSVEPFQRSDFLWDGKASNSGEMVSDILKAVV